MRKQLIEGTHIHHGSFQDSQTFLDMNGDPYILQKSSFGNGEGSESSKDGEEGKEKEQGKENKKSGSKKGQQQSPNNTSGKADTDDMSDIEGNGPETDSDQEGPQGKPGKKLGKQGKPINKPPIPPQGPDGPDGPEGPQEDKPEEGGGSIGPDGIISDEDSDTKEKKNPQKQFKVPEKGQIFNDVMSGKTYKWDGKKFVIQR